MAEDSAKESGTVAGRTFQRVSNEMILEQIQKIVEDVTNIKMDIELIKVKAHFQDKVVGMPEKKNYNTDPGPWVKPSSAPIIKG